MKKKVCWRCGGIGYIKETTENFQDESFTESIEDLESDEFVDCPVCDGTGSDDLEDG